jgi:hypothetical protein
MASLDQQVHKISSREDFVDFVHALICDLEENYNDWENPSLERYLDALAAWVKDMDGYYQNRGEPMPQQPNWRMLGEILAAARMYE